MVEGGNSAALGAFGCESEEADLGDDQADLEARQTDALAELLERAGAGEDEAWSELVEMYARRLYALARSRLGSPDTAEEITQSVLVTVALKITGGEYVESGRFEAWLFRVAMNRIRDEVRRRRRHWMESDGSFSTQVAQNKDTAEDGRLGLLRQTLEQLSDADREIVELRHHGQLSFKEIAVLTGEPMGTLLARHHRALKKLRAMMEPDKTDQELGSSR